jgi:hypothetical protein
MIEYHNPEASVGVAQTPYELGCKLRGQSGLKLGLLANGFPDSVNFLDELGRSIQRLEPGLELCSFNKGDASSPANDELIREVTADCTAVVAAYGH